MWHDFNCSKIDFHSFQSIDFISLPKQVKLNHGTKDKLGWIRVKRSEFSDLKINPGQLKRFQAHFIVPYLDTYAACSFLFSQGKIFFGPLVAVEDSFINPKTLMGKMKIHNFTGASIDLLIEDVNENIEFHRWQDCGQGVWRGSTKRRESEVTVICNKKLTDEANLYLQAINEEFITIYPFNIYLQDNAEYLPVLGEGILNVKELLKEVKDDAMVISIVNYSKDICLDQGLKSMEGSWKVGISDELLKSGLKVYSHSGKKSITLQLEIEIMSNMHKLYFLEKSVEIKITKKHEDGEVHPCYGCPFIRKCNHIKRYLLLDKKLRFR